MDARSTLDDDSALERAALGVLDANWTESATVPALGRYPHQWSTSGLTQPPLHATRCGGSGGAPPTVRAPRPS